MVNREFSALVKFRNSVYGGRKGGPPTGPIYYATATVAPEEFAKFSEQGPPEWQHFSIVLSFESNAPPRVNEWDRVRVWALVPGAPGSESLQLGAELFVMEGPHPVAELRIDGEQSC